MNVNNTLVSVILPTFNRADTLGRAISSVLNQTYRNLELIVVDDCSTDGTAELVKSVVDSRVRYVRHEMRKGGSAARNSGVREAAGDFIAFQDSDDEWLVQKLEFQVNAMASADEQVGVVFSRFVKIGDNVATIVPRAVDDLHSERIGEILKTRNVVSTQTMLLKRNVFEAVGGFDEALPRFQDWDLVFRLSAICKLLGQSEILSIVYESKNNISSNPDAACEALGIMVKKHTVQLYESGGMHVAELHYQRARYATHKYKSIAGKLARTAVRLCPTNIKYSLYYAMVVTLGPMRSALAISAMAKWKSRLL